MTFGFSLENRVSVINLEHEQPVKTTCPGCQRLIRFFIVLPNSGQDADWTGEVWMHPAPRTRAPLPVADLLPKRLVADYREAIKCYGNGSWRAAAQQTRIVLEGFTRHLLAEGGASVGNSNLAAQLQQLAKVVDLSKPIGDVSTVMRNGGNVASHFADELEIDAEMASEMLDLLDAFIDYLLLLPLRVDSLRSRLS